jgi:hypothetical protein
MMVEVRNGEVTLNGTVDDRRTKYLVEEIIEDSGCATDIHNNLRVKRQGMEESDRELSAHTGTGKSTTQSQTSRST